MLIEGERMGDLDGMGVGVPIDVPVGKAPVKVGKTEAVALKVSNPVAVPVNVLQADLEGEEDRVGRRTVPEAESVEVGVPVESPESVPPLVGVDMALVLEPMGEEDTLGECEAEREDLGVMDDEPLRVLDVEWEGQGEAVPEIVREGVGVGKTEGEPLEVEVGDAESSADTLPPPTPPSFEGVKGEEREREGEEDNEGDREPVED